MRLHLILSTLFLAGAGTLAAPRPEALDLDADVAARDAAPELPACLAKRLQAAEDHDERDVEIPTEHDVEIPTERDVSSLPRSLASPDSRSKSPSQRAG